MTALAGVCAIVIAGCGGGGSTSAPSAPIATPTPQATRAEVTNHLTPLGELRIPLSMIYSADGFGQRTITLKNAVSFTDDRGNATMIGANASVVSHEVAPQ
jgi:hypothetical protein